MPCCNCSEMKNWLGILVCLSFSFHLNATEYSCSDTLRKLNELLSVQDKFDTYDSNNRPFYIEIVFKEFSLNTFPEQIKSRLVAMKEFELVEAVAKQTPPPNLASFAAAFLIPRDPALRRMSQLTSPPFPGAAFTYERGFGHTIVFSVYSTHRKEEKAEAFLPALQELLPLIESIKFRDDLTQGKIKAKNKEKKLRTSQNKIRNETGKDALLADSKDNKFFYFTVWYQLPDGINKRAYFKFPATFETLHEHFGEWLTDDVLTRRSFKFGTTLDFIGEGAHIGYDNGKVETVAQALATLKNFRSILEKKFKYLALGELIDND
jgi:hypothetical protein